MDCEACTDRLIDLLYGEIDDADAEAARAHLDGCETCAGAFERVTAGHELATMLVMEEPPESVLEGVMAAARERAGRISAKPEPVAQPVQVVPREAHERAEDDEGGLWSSLMRWLGSFAMGPQVAMATMLFLMVGIGLWYLPDWRGIDPTDTHAIVSPLGGDEVGPSAGLVPAEPLALEEDPHRARIRPRGQDDVAPAPPRGRPAAPAADAPPPPVRDRHATAELAPTAPAPRDRLQATPVEREAEALALGQGQPLAMDHPSEGAPSALPSAPQQAFAQPPPPATPGTAAAGRSSSATPSAPSAPTIARAESEPSSHDMLPPALHQLARNQAAADTCAQAIGTYERLLARYPSYPRASEARVELADCYRRTGRLTQARRSLETASRDPRTSSRAQRELVRLEAAERAMDRQRAETERTPDPPAARSADDQYEAVEPSSQ